MEELLLKYPPKLYLVDDLKNTKDNKTINQSTFDEAQTLNDMQRKVTGKLTETQTLSDFQPMFGSKQQNKESQFGNKSPNPITQQTNYSSVLHFNETSQHMDEECGTANLQKFPKPIKPFPRQVGGHTTFLSMNGYLFKPILSNELVLSKIKINAMSFPKKCPFFDTNDETNASSNSESILVNEPSNVHSILTAIPLRPSQPKFREVNFYNYAFRQSYNTLPLKKFLCNFYGCRQLSENTLRSSTGDSKTAFSFKQLSPIQQLEQKQNGNASFLVLDDLTSHFSCPSIIDIKLGCCQYIPWQTTEAKRKSQDEKCRLSTSLKLGFRACGMMTYREDLHRFTFFNKYIGRKLTEEEISDFLKLFFFNGKRVYYSALQSVLRKCEELIEALKVYYPFSIFSSSLLIVYESDPTLPLHTDVRLIDFAKAIIHDHAYAVENVNNHSSQPINTNNNTLNYNHNNSNIIPSDITPTHSPNLNTHLHTHTHTHINASPSPLLPLDASDRDREYRDRDDGLFYGLTNLVRVLNTIH